MLYAFTVAWNLRGDVIDDRRNLFDSLLVDFLGLNVELLNLFSFFFSYLTVGIEIFWSVL